MSHRIFWNKTSALRTPMRNESKTLRTYPPAKGGCI
jgi:hypothetical protein